MANLLIDHDKAHDVFAGIVQAHTALIRTTRNYMIPVWPIDMNDLNNELSARIAELEALITQAPSAPPRKTGSIGRPAKSEEEKKAQLADLEAKIAATSDKAVKLALGKAARRIKRSLSTPQE